MSDPMLSGQGLSRAPQAMGVYSSESGRGGILCDFLEWIRSFGGKNYLILPFLESLLEEYRPMATSLHNFALISMFYPVWEPELTCY